MARSVRRHIQHAKGCHGGMRTRLEVVRDGYVDFWAAVHHHLTYSTGGACTPRVYVVTECPRCGNGDAHAA